MSDDETQSLGRARRAGLGGRRHSAMRAQSPGNSRLSQGMA